MVIAIVFFLLLVTVILAWGAKRDASIILYIITLGMAVFWFIHHISTPLTLQL